MKFIAQTIPFLSLLLATPTFAAPTTQTVTIALSNDNSGAYGPGIIPLDGSVNAISTIYANTNINQGGSFSASSASLTSGLGYNPTCIIQSAPGVTAGQLTSTKTYLKFGNNPDMLQVVNFSQGTISCTA